MVIWDVTTLLSSENTVIIINTNWILATGNYRTLEPFLNESNRVISDAGPFELSDEDRRFLKLTVIEGYQIHKIGGRSFRNECYRKRVTLCEIWKLKIIYWNSWKYGFMEGLRTENKYRHYKSGHQVGNQWASQEKWHYRQYT